MLDQLLFELEKRESSLGVFNQYKKEHIKNNLKLYLKYLIQHRPKIMMVGEAPGYNGCRLTGIPFTSGRVICDSKHVMFKDIGDKCIIEEIVSEPTARIFWGFLGEDLNVPILWNAFPFHPHKMGNDQSNRKPTSSEIKEGSKYLVMVYNIFKPEKLCSLGRVGEKILRSVFPSEKISYIRHPSYGGQKDFRIGMNEFFDCR